MYLGVWSTVAILYQTILCIIISWLTLGCKLSPESSELHEVTLMKLLYLYDPEACGRVHFYNYTTQISHNKFSTTVVWPVRNDIAAKFRSKIQVWLSLHIVWALLCIVNITQGDRPCGFYATLLPFTLTGLALLVVDIVFATLFLLDAKNTGTELDIFDYINSNKGNLHSIIKIQPLGDQNYEPIIEDTSWISVLLAYTSFRGVVQWIFNFWIVKDSYFEGLAEYRRLSQNTPKNRCSKKSQLLKYV